MYTKMCAPLWSFFNSNCGGPDPNKCPAKPRIWGNFFHWLFPELLSTTVLLRFLLQHTSFCLLTFQHHVLGRQEKECRTVTDTAHIYRATLLYSSRAPMSCSCSGYLFSVFLWRLTHSGKMLVFRITRPKELEVHKQAACWGPGGADGFTQSSAKLHSQECRVSGEEISWLQDRPQHAPAEVSYSTEELCSPLRKRGHGRELFSLCPWCLSLQYCREGCAGCAEAIACYVLSKTTEEKMVQPLLCLRPSRMSKNNKNGALKNKTHCFKKPSGEYFQWYIFFCVCASFWSFFFF